MARPNSLQSKIERRIAESREYVFLTREFTDLSGRRQVLRALRKVVAEGRLVRLGCGVYGLAFTSGLSELSSRKGIWTLGKWGRIVTRPGCWTVRALVCAISVPHASAAATIVKLIFLMVWFILLLISPLFGCLVFSAGLQLGGAPLNSCCGG